jgi:hypothetical protein
VDSAFAGTIINTAEVTTTTPLVHQDSLKASVESQVIEATSLVSGSVVDKNGVGIEGAIVSLTETLPAANAAVMSADLSAVTDGDGNYAIGDVPLGEYTLSVILPGESEPAHTQSISVGANLVNEIDPIIVSTSEDLYLPSVRKR